MQQQHLRANSFWRRIKASKFLKMPQRWPCNGSIMDQDQDDQLINRSSRYAKTSINILRFATHKANPFDSAIKLENSSKMTNDWINVIMTLNWVQDRSIVACWAYFEDFRKDDDCVLMLAMWASKYAATSASNFNSFDGTSKPENSKFLKLKQNWILLPRGMASI